MGGGWTNPVTRFTAETRRTRRTCRPVMRQDAKERQERQEERKEGRSCGPERQPALPSLPGVLALLASWRNNIRRLRAPAVLLQSAALALGFVMTWDPQQPAEAAYGDYGQGERSPQQL